MKHIHQLRSRHTEVNEERGVKKENSKATLKMRRGGRRFCNVNSKPFEFFTGETNRVKKSTATSVFLHRKF